MSREQTSFPDNEDIGTMDSREFQALAMGFNSSFDPRYLMYEVEKRVQKRARLHSALQKGVDRLLSIAQPEEIDTLPTRGGIYEKLSARDPSGAQSQSRAIGGMPSVRSNRNA